MSSREGANAHLLASVAFALAALCSLASMVTLAALALILAAWWIVQLWPRNTYYHNERCTGVPRTHIVTLSNVDTIDLPRVIDRVISALDRYSEVSVTEESETGATIMIESSTCLCAISHDVQESLKGVAIEINRCASYYHYEAVKHPSVRGDGQVEVFLSGEAPPQSTLSLRGQDIHIDGSGVFEVQISLSEDEIEQGYVTGTIRSGGLERETSFPISPSEPGPASFT